MTNRAAATRYARALFDVSLDRDDPERSARDLQAFSSVMADHDVLGGVLINPAVASAKKRGVVEAILARMETSPIVKRLLLMLAERDRLELLPDLIEVYHDRLMAHLGVVRARITTAVPLEADRVRSVTATLAEATGRKVTVETAVDESLLGGMVTQIGSTVYDGSIARHLGRLRQRFLTGS